VELTEEDFAHPGYRYIWGAMLDLHKAALPCDQVTLKPRIDEATYAVLSDVATAAISAINAEHYATLVKKSSLTRNVRKRVLTALDSGNEGEDLLGSVYAALTSFDSITSDRSKSMTQIVEESFVELRYLVESGGKWGVETGFKELDVVTGGLPIGAITVIAARPGMGKSSLARQIADNVSARGEGVHVFSMEDSQRFYSLRAISQHADISLQDFKSLRVKATELETLKAQTDGLRRSHWVVDETPSVTAAQVATRVRRLKKSISTRLVVVDYLQLMSDPKAEGQEEQVRRSVEALASLARRESVACIVVAQLNRENVREERRPRMTDLRGSGAIEQVADTIIMLHRNEREGQNAEVIVEKSKNGRTGAFVLKWDGRTTSFKETIQPF
jgi:replicative DNA helicase